MNKFLRGLFSGISSVADNFTEQQKLKSEQSGKLELKNAEFALQQMIEEKKRKQGMMDDILKIAISPLFKGVDKDSVPVELPADLDFGAALGGAGLNIPPEFAMTLKKFAGARPQKRQSMNPFSMTPPDSLVSGGSGGIGGAAKGGSYLTGKGASDWLRGVK